MPGPLQGVKVLDLGRVIAAPYSSMLLADLGADVIKVERPGGNGNGDEMRAYGPPFLKDKEGKQTGESPYYISSNRSKRAICVDFGRPEGQEIVRDLAKSADVLIENYKVGDLARYKLDYENLRQINDRLIYCSITGFGQTGPWAKRAGLDIMFQSLSGIMSMTGEADGPPLRVGMAFGDIMGGIHAAYAILGALYHRDARGGKGQWIDLSLLDATFSTLSHRVQTYLVSGEQPPRIGNATAGSVPADAFTCKDGKTVMMQAFNDVHFKRLCAAIGHPELAEDKRYGTRTDRYENRDGLNEMLVATFKTRNFDEWTESLTQAQIIHAPVNDIAEAVNHPQLKHREMTFDIPHPLAGSMPIIRNPVRYSETPLDRYFASPTVGQHTDDVLQDLGLSREKVAQLRAGGIVR
jgi:crotonobetainyl-CoA:carnitine CoA-transferase CaiB-like acyl-CoA transferase